MAQAFTCPSGPIVNPDNTLSCSAWVMVELPAPDPIHELTPQQLSDITAQIFLAFALAFVFKFATRWLLQSGFGRNSE